MKSFGAFPNDKWLPESVRPVVDRYVEIRTEADSASADIQALRGKIREGDDADIAEAAEILATGQETQPGTSNRDAAIRAVEAAERNSRALNQALPRVAAELKAAFVAASDEVYQLANDEYERASGAYTAAIEALADARKAWLHAIAARRFADDATTGQREAHYETPHVDDSFFADFRKEVSTPDDQLFAPRMMTRSIHHANAVQQFLIPFNIPSYAAGNTLTVADHPDYDKAIERLESRSDWYVDGDCVRTDVPPRRVDIVKVKELPAGMNAEWVSTAPSRKTVPARHRPNSRS